MTRLILPAAAAITFGLTSCLALPDVDAIVVYFDGQRDADVASFFVTQEQTVNVVVEVPPDTTSNKLLTLKTTFGEVNSAASDLAGKASVTLRTVGDQSFTVPLKIATAGIGVVSVEGPDGGLGTARFSVQTAEKMISIEAADTFVTGPANSASIVVRLQPDPRETEPTPSPLPTRKARVRVTRGALDPQRQDAARVEREVFLTQGQATTLDFFPGLEPGPGEILVTLESGAQVRHPFDIAASDDEVAFEVPTGLYAGGSATDIGISMTSGTTEEQRVTLQTTHIVLDPSAPQGPARYQRTIRLTPGAEAKAVRVYMPATEGPASITATLPSQEAFTQGFDVSRLPGTPDIAPADPSIGYYADGESLIPLVVSLSQGAGVRRTIQVSASTGILDASAMSEEARRVRSLIVEDEGSQTIFWRTSRVSGTALVTVAIADHPLIEREFFLQYSAPTYLTVGTTRTLLQSSASSITISATFGRPLGQGRVSFGTEVFFLTCCDPDNDAVQQDCGALVDVTSPAVAPSSGEDIVTATLALTPEGTAFVDAPGAPPTDDEPIELHAFILDPGTPPGELFDCSSLSDPDALPAAIAAYDVRMLSLRRAQP